jgi:hypothetical protein
MLMHRFCVFEFKFVFEFICLKFSKIVKPLFLLLLTLSLFLARFALKAQRQKS